MNLNEEDVTFPIFLTEDELRELINTPHSASIWEQVNYALAVFGGKVEYGETE
jgi:hypothetical protein